MKQFKDLQPGDIIYYYDHCKMKPRKVISCEMKEFENKIDTWRGYEVRKEKKLTITCEHGDPITICCTYNNGEITMAWGNSGKIYSCREAAEDKLNKLKNYRKRKIQEAQERVNRYTNIMNKYEIL